MGCERPVGPRAHDDHEPTDVRVPEGIERVPSTPETPPGADSPVSEARARELFDYMKSKSCGGPPCDPLSCEPAPDFIPFLYPDNGCWIRAHIMCLLMREGGPDNPPVNPRKAWIRTTTVSNTVPTANHPGCCVPWGQHVAPTLEVILPGGQETWVIDPSLFDEPVSLAEWQNRIWPRGTVEVGPWTDYESEPEGEALPFQDVDLTTANADMKEWQNKLVDRCNDPAGPPPYSCPRNCFFIMDRNTFSNREIEAMLNADSHHFTRNPGLVKSAFYIVVDGFSPRNLGFTSEAMEITPLLKITPDVSEIMTITPDRLEFEDPDHLHRRHA